jgi:hypothetical protein
LGNILQGKWAEGLERQIELLAHMVAHRARDADTTDRTDGLQPGCYVYATAVNIRAVREDITDIDADAKPDAPVGRLVAVKLRHTALHRNRAAYRRGGAGELEEQGIPRSIHEPAVVLAQFRLDQVAKEYLYSSKSARIIELDQPAVAGYVGMDDGDKLTGARYFLCELLLEWPASSAGTTRDLKSCGAAASSSGRQPCLTRPPRRRPGRVGERPSAAAILGPVAAKQC